MQITDSDKFFWHHYTEIYSEVFNDLKDHEEFDILEIGVLNSESIKFWRNCFPQAKITGLDLHVKEDWFKDEKTNYIECDQSNPRDLNDIIKSLENPLLLIDDGSHIPHHQLIFLDIALQNLLKNKSNSSRYIIIEDIHTSIEQCFRNRNSNYFSKFKQTFTHKQKIKCHYEELSKTFNSYSILNLARKINSKFITRESFQEEYSSLLNGFDQETKIILNRILDHLSFSTKISIYKRGLLPNKCWRCHSPYFCPVKLRCSECNEDLLQNSDSMLSLIKI